MHSYRYIGVLALFIYSCGSTSPSDMNAGAGSSASGNASAGAGSPSASNASAGAGAGSVTNPAESTSCTGQEALCPSIPFGLCTEVQMTEGRCVDWSKSKATPCTSPLECPRTYPTGNFGTAAFAVRAICVKATYVEYTTAGMSAESGYCAATAAVTDTSGALNCSSDPCGDTGYCSYNRNNAGTSIVECTWAI